jgi:EmrB/QacA subfamily drug resistance transporter
MNSEGLVAARGNRSVAAPWTRRQQAILAVLCVSLLVVSLDSTIVNIVLPALVRDLHASESQLQWVVDAYTCVFAGLLLVIGALGDRVGRKKVFAAGLAVFAAGSAGSSFSGSVWTLVSCRAVMGLGAAAIMPATLSIITDVFRDPGQQRKAIGLWSGTTGLGIAIGPIVGGWLLAHYWWGSVFLINVPIATLGLVAVILLVPESRDPARRPVDVPGGMLSVSGMALLLWAIIEIPTDGWRSLSVLVAGAGAVLLLAGFIGWERRSVHPMLVLGPFTNRRFSVAMGTIALAVFALMGALFMLTQYLQFALHYSAFDTGLRILPVAGILGAAAVSSTVLDRWIGTKWVVAAGLLIVAGGLYQMTTTTVAEGFGHALIGMCLLAFGAGFIIAPATASVMGALPRTRAGVGSATNSTALQLGGAIGVAVVGSIASARYKGLMAPLLAGHAMPAEARSAILGSIGGAQEVARMAGGTLGAELSNVAGSSFVNGMDLALTVGAVAVGVSVILALAALPSRARPEPPVDEDPGKK